MGRIEKGMLAKSLAGHDKGYVYLILDIQDGYVYLADGKYKTIQAPKKKKIKHIQIICNQYNIEGIDDVGIKRILKEGEKLCQKQM